MFHFDISALSALSPAALKKEALKAFETACASPVEAPDWHSLSLLLHAALTAKATRKAADDGVPVWWRCDKFGKKAERVSIAVTFADGQVVRASVNTDPGKPFNIGRGVKVAIAFYRQRIFKAAGCPEVVRLSDRNLAGICHVRTPAIVALSRLDTGEEFDAGEVSRLTAEWRAGPWDIAEARLRAAAVPMPDEMALRDCDPAKWEAYQLQLDYSRTWLAHCEEARAVGWRASYEDMREAIELRQAPGVAAPADERDPIPGVVALDEERGESMLADEAAAEAAEPHAPEEASPAVTGGDSGSEVTRHARSILNRLSGQFSGSITRMPSLPVAAPRPACVLARH